MNNLNELISNELPQDFVQKIEISVSSAYDEASLNTDDDPDLTYSRNEKPHRKNKKVFENIHNLASNYDSLSVTTKVFPNAYRYIEIETSNLCIHVSHRSNYEGLKVQHFGANYKKEKSGYNPYSGQIFIDGLGPDDNLNPEEKLYLVLYFQDSEENKDELGKLYFVYGTNSNDTLAIAYIEDILNCYPISETEKPIEQIPNDFEFESNRDDSIRKKM